MKNKTVVTWLLSLLLVLSLVGCDKNKLGTQPQIPDLNSVGCLIANDFYAVHFSVYVKTAVAPKDASDREALLKPYCQELSTTGKAFFAADLIDRDIRKTPIGIRVVELELTQSDDMGVMERLALMAKYSKNALTLLIKHPENALEYNLILASSSPEDFKEVRTINEVAPKVYSKGVVEAQADIDKNGYYALFLIIGGEEAISDEDKLRVAFHVGGDSLFKQTLMLMAVGVVILFLIIITALIWYWKKRKAARNA